MNRRDFLATSALSTAGFALASCARAPAPVSVTSRKNPPEVLIAGAGIAGLSAGYQLMKTGVPFRIIEAQNRPGGRMLSLSSHFPDNQVAELGGELIDTNHEHMRRLASELGLELDDLHTEPASLAPEVFFFEGRNIPATALEAEFEPIGKLIGKDLERLGTDSEITWRNPGSAGHLDRLSLTEWFEKAGLTGWLGRLLDIAYTTEYGLESGEQSALNFLTMIKPGLGEGTHLFGESDERFKIQGGNDLLPRKLAEKLSPWIDYETRLEAIDLSSNGLYKVSLRKGEKSVERRATAVLLTVPFTLLRNVAISVEMPERKRQAIQELGYGTNAKLMTAFGERLWRTRYQSVGSVLSDLPFQMCWETSRLQAGKHGILNNFTGGKQGLEVGKGSAEEQARTFVRDLERVFPGLMPLHQAEQAVRFHWPSNPYVLGSYACYRPGQWTRFRGIEGEPVGRLYFAGEHCSLSAQGFMEGGCETGERAAAAIAKLLGRPV